MLESGGLVCDRSRGRIGLGLEVGAGLEAEWPGNEAAWNPQDQLVVIPYPLVIPPPLHRYPVSVPASSSIRLKTTSRLRSSGYCSTTAIRRAVSSWSWLAASTRCGDPDDAA